MNRLRQILSNEFAKATFVGVFFTGFVLQQIQSPWRPWALDTGRALEDSSASGFNRVASAIVGLGADVHYDYDGPLRLAALNGQNKTVKMLLDHGADLHAWGDIALKWAAQQGHADTVKLLVERGADIHAGNEEAVRRAWDNDHDDIVRYLEEKGSPLRPSPSSPAPWNK